jgi:predicted RNA-binding protein with RPS1 domain
MSLVSFAEYLHMQGLTFGLQRELLGEIARRSLNGESCTDLLAGPDRLETQITTLHLLKIRRALLRYQALSSTADSVAGEFYDRQGILAAAWAAGHSQTEKQAALLAAGFAAASAKTLKRGRLRVHLKVAAQACPDELSQLAEHSEACAEIPPHRWFAIGRGVSAGMLWVEVLPPTGELEQALGPAASPELVEDLARSLAKPVLDTITERANRQVVSAAAGALYGLLGKPPLPGVVAGLAIDKQAIHVCRINSVRSDHPEQAEFRIKDMTGLVEWLAERKIEYIGLARIGGQATFAGLIQVLTQNGLLLEPVSEAGLMKQARDLPGTIKAAAALVVARRFQDPLLGYAGLEPDQMGLGEYLDRVDAQQLQAALQDVKDVVTWEKQQAQTGRRISRGFTFNPMIKSLADLRPGIELNGFVTNLTHFGAFVELGLRVQGLIHLSELDNKFIQHPSEVVQLGQRVGARVIEVDRQKGRISLSLRDQSRKRPAEKNKRTQTLKKLDAVFKK